MRTFLLLALASTVPACSADGLGDNANTMPATPPDMTAPPDLTPAPFPASHPDAPQVTTSGGPVLSAPRIVPILFAADDATMKMQIADFTAKVGATSYWNQTTSEYGVGPATSATPVELSEAAPVTITDSEIQTWLAGKLDSDDPAFPANNRNTLYAIYYPTGTTITTPGRGGVSTSCVDFGGYHDSLQLNPQHGRQKVAYAVIPRCDTFGDMQGIDAVTSTASHEYIEAVSDPYPAQDPAFSTVDDNHFVWSLILGGGENGDMCAQDPASFTTFPELPYTVQRSWSNVAASAGKDPCVPALAKSIYFNAVPEMNDQISLGNNGSIPGVLVPVGTSKTINLDLFSESDTHTPWSVRVVDAFGGPTSSFTFSTDHNLGRNGDRIKLTITSLKGTSRKHGTFMVVSKLGLATHYWFGFIGQ